jgi:hypothetical protein
VRVEIGPVDANAAEVWTDHMLGNLAVIRTQLEKLPFKLPEEIVDELGDLLRRWNDHAVEAIADQKDFRWQQDFDEADVHRLVQYWANLDSLTEEHLDRFGIKWSPLESRPFFDALAAGVAGALQHDPFADLLLEHGEARRGHHHNQG